MSNKIDALVSIAAGTSQVPLIKKAKEMGYEVIAVDKNPKAPGFFYSSEKLIINTHYSETIISELFKLTNRYTLCGVVARSNGKALFTSAKIANTFNLPGLTNNFVRLTTEKSALRDFCMNNKIAAPKGVRVRSKLPKKLSFPLIVKPDSTLVGKKGISFAYDSLQLSDKINLALETSANDYAEVEEFIDGIDVSCLFWSRFGNVHIVTFWDELVGVDFSYSIKGLGVSIPSVIEGSNIEKKINKVASAISSLFPKISIPLIISLRVDWNSNVYLIEIHADLGGDLIGEKLLPVANPKFDFFESAILIAVGKFKSSQIQRKFKPVSLIYENGAKKQKVAYIYKSDQLKVNLEKTFMGISSTYKLFKMPNHYQWWAQSQRIIK